MDFAQVLVSVSAGPQLEPENTPLIVGGDTINARVNQAEVIMLSTLLDNDSDDDGDNLRITGASSALNSSLNFNDSAQTMTFTPTQDFSGTARFNYTLSDGAAVVSGRVNVVVEVTAIPTPNPIEGDLRTYVFGHSLINHEAGEATFQTNVPYWVGRMANAAGRTYGIEGQYGFLSQHANLTPVSQWGFQGIESIWNHESNISFADADFNSILLTAANIAYS